MTATQIRGGQCVGPADQIPEGEGRAFAVHGEQVAVFRLRDGSVRAVGAVCPHRGGPIADGQTDGTVVLCPLHLTAFELATGCSPTGEEPLPIYPVELHDGEIVVHPRSFPGGQAPPRMAAAAEPRAPYPTSAIDATP